MTGYKRVRTEFWIQNSRLFPDFLPNQYYFFVQTQGYQITVNSRLADTPLSRTPR